MRQFAYGLLLSATLGSAVTAQQVDQAEVLRQLDHLRSALVAEANGSVGVNAGAIATSPNPTRSVTIGVASKQYPVEQTKQYVIRAYDLADMFAIAPNSRAVDWISETSQSLLPTGSWVGNAGGVMGGGMGGGMGGMFGVMDNGESGASPDDLIELLKSVTDGEWDSEEETIYQLGGTLVVRATESSQRQIESLLDLLSQRWNSKVVVRTEIDYVYLSKDESARAQKSLDAEAGSNQEHWSQTAWNEFRDQLGGEDRPGGYHVRLTGFNGQHLAWTSGEQHRTIADVQMTKRGRLESLNLNHPHCGIVCESRTSLSHNKDMATLNISSRLLRAGFTDESTLAEPVTGVKVDRQSTVGQSIAVSTRIPLDTVSLIAIGTDDEYDTPWQLHVVASIHEVKKP